MMKRQNMQEQLWQKDVVLAPARNHIARALRAARRTGVLSLPAKTLSEFPPQVYHLEEHLEKDEKKWECVDLVKIDLSHNDISSISNEINGLTSVTSIKLAKNALQVLPDGMFELKTLTYLDLSCNQLERDLTERFGTLINLRELNLSGNKLSRLPDSIALLCNLEALHIDENALTTLPKEIGNLRKLHVLNAHTNQLTSLPLSFGGLKRVQNLNLKKNRLESTDDKLSTLILLKFLDLRQNRLQVFPQLPEAAALDQIFLGNNKLASIDDSSILRVKDSITVLDMRDNKLKELSVSIACLYRLKTLDVANNDLSSLPPGLGYLKHLNHFIVDGNPLRSIRRSVISNGCESLKKYLRTRGAPVEIDVLDRERDELQINQERLVLKGNSEAGEGQLLSVDYTAQFREAAAFRKLALTNSSLGILPSDLVGQGVFNFGSTLLHLDLSLNHLRLLPAAIGELISLKTLTVEENELKTLHPSIAALPHLEQLRLRKNRLTATTISEFLKCSTALVGTLKELDLRSNRISYLPVEIGQLRSLETLLLCFNSIESLDRFPWAQLTNVNVVSISDNKLRSLGRIFDAPLLTSLSFENNNLTKVPCELSLCPHLRAIYMNGNPQRTVRGGVIAKGSAEILAYLRNKLSPNAALSSPLSPTMSCNSKLGQSRTFGASSRSKGGNTVTSRLLHETYAAQGTVTVQDREVASVAAIDNAAIKHHPTENAAIESELSKLSKQIEHLEQQLESHTLSAPTRFSLKKKLAMVRSKKIREARKQH